jgi:hypothetical protein
MTRREPKVAVKTKGASNPWEESVGELITEQMAVGV